jgi:5'-nucleotidase (lipoprotein e(P4) family)
LRSAWVRFWAVVLDADETILDNSLYQKVRGFFGYTPASWDAWVRMRAAKRLPGAAPFLREIKSLGGTVAIVTDRGVEVAAQTAANLRSEELPFDILLCKPSSGDTSKAARWKMIENGTAATGVPPLRIEMWVGDNIRDFPGGDQGVTDDAFYSNFGDRFFVLPNAMYGSWTAASRR